MQIMRMPLITIALVFSLVLLLSCFYKTVEAGINDGNWYDDDDKFQLIFNTTSVTLIVNQTESIELNCNGTVDNDFNVTFKRQYNNLIDISPEFLRITPENQNDSNIILIFGRNPGHLLVSLLITSNKSDGGGVDGGGGIKYRYWNDNNGDPFIRITVAKSILFIYFAETIGWIYFFAWSISFYPQIYENFKRKSVVGLNFDFVALNVVGFTLYGIFNCGLFWDHFIQQEYFHRFPRGLNPVMLNDVVFSLHAIIANIIIIFQCIIYEKAEQTVSYVTRTILIIIGILVTVFHILASVETMHWLDFLYYCSYIKLFITLVKYIPQAIMNHRRRSTIGWSIGNIFLDFTGGMFSMLQMVVNSYNYNDWASIFGDGAKFGLGLISVLFDVFFLVQHYCLYRNGDRYIAIDGNDSDEVHTADPVLDPVETT